MRVPASVLCLAGLLVAPLAAAASPPLPIYDRVTYEAVPTGASVDVIDEPIKVAHLEGDTILLEAHPGIAEHDGVAANTFLERIKSSAIADLVDFAAAQRVAHDARGVAVDVTKKRAAAPR